MGHRVAACTICSDELNKPTAIVTCGHVFCRECLDDYHNHQLRSRHPMVCPLCRVPFRGRQQFMTLFLEMEDQPEAPSSSNQQITERPEQALAIPPPFTIPQVPNPAPDLELPEHVPPLPPTRSFSDATRELDIFTLHGIKLKNQEISDLKHELNMTRNLLSVARSHSTNISSQKHRLEAENHRVIAERNRLVEVNRCYLQAGRALETEVGYLRDELKVSVQLVHELEKTITQQQGELFLYYGALTNKVNP